MGIKDCYPEAELVLRILTDDSTSLCRLSAKYGASLHDAKDLLRLAKDLELNIGGVFVDETFEMFAGNLHEALEEHFPSHVRVIGEPGRYYTSNAFTLATNVIARREVAGDNEGENAYMLYLNDGVYGNFSNIIFDHQHPIPQILSAAATDDEMVEYSIWGPTCDGIDVITDQIYLPGVINIDWLFF